MAIERYLGGGRLYFARLKPDGTHDTQREIGEVKSLTLTVKLETEQAYSVDDGFAELVMELEKKKDMTLKFTTQNVDAANLALALYGETGVVVYRQGETLPNGTVATQDTTVPAISVGTSSLIEGRLVFVSNAGTNLIKRRRWTFHKVSLRMEGDISLISEKFVTIPFTATVLKDKSIQNGSQYAIVEEL